MRRGDFNGATDPGPTPRARDGGAILLVMMLMMVVLLGLGLMGLWMTSGNLQVQANNNLRAQALKVAEAGIERARSVLNAGVNIDALLAGTGNTGDDVPRTLDSAGMPAGVGAVFIDTVTPLSSIAFPPTSFGRTAGTGDAPVATTMGTYTVWIRNDTAECREGLFLTDKNGTVLVRSRGVAADKLTTVVLEVALGATPATPGADGGVPGVAPVLCVSGKNACDDNNSTIAGIVAD